LLLASPAPAVGKPKAPSKEDRAAIQRKARAQMAKMRRIMTLNSESIEHFKAGRFDRCKSKLQEILKIDPNNDIAHYNLACLYSRRENFKKAIDELNTAINNGYMSFAYMEQDPDLDPLRKMPGYKKILGRRDKIQRDRAEKILAGLKKRFGDKFICEVDHDNKLVFATDVDTRTLRELKVSLSKYAAAQWKTLFDNHFDEYVTVVIPRVPKTLPRRLGGAYDPGNRQLIVRSIGMVLTHEFTHALHFADQAASGQAHPIWVIEGLATLFESSKLVDGKATPLPNHRANVLRGVLRRDRAIRWREFFKLSHAEYMEKSAVAYPQGRYIFMYLYEKGLLKKWYDAYKAGYETDRTGAKAIEKVTGKSLEKVEADWLKWADKLKDVPLRLSAKQAYIGVQLSRQIDGLKILRIVPGSAADLGGLKTGDVIIKLDGRRMADTGELLRTVTAHKVGDKVKIEFRRNGKYKTITIKLGAVPSDLSWLRWRSKKSKYGTEPARNRAA
ncbi:MAG: PDZ domain-containing protein, partial [Phycisphaerae bacterium]|nr:PDZ domain-containing protein [Phycisphaerae bacterium]